MSDEKTRHVEKSPRIVSFNNRSALELWVSAKDSGRSLVRQSGSNYHGGRGVWDGEGRGSGQNITMGNVPVYPSVRPRPWANPAREWLTLPLLRHPVEG